VPCHSCCALFHEVDRSGRYVGETVLGTFLNPETPGTEKIFFTSSPQSGHAVNESSANV
jgi:hypothetical protein